MGAQLKQVHSNLREINERVVQGFAGPQMTHTLVKRFLGEIGRSEPNIHEFVKATQLRLESSLLKSAYNQIGGGTSVPRLAHRIWVTSNTSPALPPEPYVEQIFQAAEHPQNILTHIFWTNNAEVAEVVHGAARRRGTPILIADLALFDRDDLYRTVEAFIADKKFVLAADVTKFLVLDRFGGIYGDLGIRYDLRVIELAGIVDYCLLLADNLFFQTCFVACPANSDLSGVFLAAMSNPEALAPYFMGPNDEISSLDEVAVFAGPAFTAIAMLFLPEFSRTVIFPQKSDYISWGSLQSWYTDGKKFGNTRVKDSKVSVLDAKKHHTYQLRAKQNVTFFGQVGSLRQKLVLLTKIFGYFQTHPTRLCNILKFNGSDKALGWHNYSPIYNFIFSHYVGRKPAIFEVGMGTNFLDIPSSMGATGVPGASLQAWREFFLNAEVFGGDVDSRILFQEEHIRTFFVDQTKPHTIKALWEEVGDIEFDLILDDGLHEFDANINFLEGSMQQLKQDGIFVIEDIVYGYLPQWENYINKRNLNAAIVRLPHDTNHQDNCFVIILKPPKSDIDKVFDGGNQDQNR